MKDRLLRAYARCGTRPWCRQTLRKLDGGLIRAAEHHFKSRSVEDLIRLVGGKQVKKWIPFRPRNFRGTQVNRRGPDAFDDAVVMLRRAHAKGSKRPQVRQHWLGYAYLGTFEKGAIATAHWLQRIGSLRHALEAAGDDVAAAWQHKPRKNQKPLRSEDPRVRAARRQLVQWGVALSDPRSDPITPAPPRVPTMHMASQPKFGSLGGKKKRATSSALPDWEDEDEDRPRHGPVGSMDDALEALGAASGAESLAHLVR